MLSLYLLNVLSDVFVGLCPLTVLGVSTFENVAQESQIY